ncbi:hypothetical protein [Streptomyces sp. NRRL S-813]|uniref:hypothetical protein n=1 Tax=Streptomyces sp. NRRL S-813 TaxID=1463919 RepID=UPI00131B781C|nr:hypothetical protein [Streptomyces sp. NRRL S-813]
MLWTFDTAIDRGPHDAEARAAKAGWLTDAYADQLRSRRPQLAPGAQWREWAGHRAYTTVVLEKTEDASKPADTGTEAWRQWAVTATATGRDHWVGEPVTITLFVQLTRTAANKAWRIAAVTIR